MEGLTVEFFFILGDAFGEESTEVIAGGYEISQLHFAVLEDMPGVCLSFFSGGRPIVSDLFGRLGSKYAYLYLFIMN